MEALRVILVPGGVGDGDGRSCGVPDCEANPTAPKPAVKGRRRFWLLALRGDGRCVMLLTLMFRRLGGRAPCRLAILMLSLSRAGPLFSPDRDFPFFMAAKRLPKPLLSPSRPVPVDASASKAAKMLGCSSSLELSSDMKGARSGSMMLSWWKAGRFDWPRDES